MPGLWPEHRESWVYFSCGGFLPLISPSHGPNTHLKLGELKEVPSNEEMSKTQTTNLSVVVKCLNNSGKDCISHQYPFLGGLKGIIV